MNLSEELIWRGFINQTTLKDLNKLNSMDISFYHGFDASVNSLTIGNLAAVMMDKCFIRHGAKATIISGGATSLIGDPGGKDIERPLQSRQTIDSNVTAVHNQLRYLLGSKTRFLNNLDWLGKINVLDFLRDVGKYFSMTPLVQRDYIAKRMGKDGSGITYTELSYTLLQGYDFLYLNQKYGVNFQIAGSDQWGNCLSGVELIKKVENKTVNVFTCPLIINQATGVKFGKSEQGAVWLDPKLTSPLDFYQFWINSDDKGVISYLKIFTELSKIEIDEIEKTKLTEPASRTAQRTLAYEVTKLVHGEDTAKNVELATQVLTGKLLLMDLNKKALNNLKNYLKFLTINRDSSLTDILTASGLVSSKTEARRLIESGSIYLNNDNYKDDLIDFSKLKTNYAMLRRGKAYKDTIFLEIKK
ncbi:MAG TPA: tyrosine--tRNA ligase [Candidatus Saccharimonadales bacterium]|jgi:tyrosyl-tRNA synthetase|nr:tyrosine--tRNA ligase [Candidatus Saccharimonadales bacterium]